MRKLLLATVAALGASMGVATVADAQTASPAPGTVSVRLNGRFRAYGFYTNDRDVDNNSANTGVASTVTGQGTATGSYKQGNFGIAEYARLYPGFDGVAANGLKYGASLEIRQDNANIGAGGGALGSITGTQRARGNLYLRREWGYIGTDKLGTIRLGSTDQPSSLYMTGNFENFNDGGWNGDTPAFMSSPVVPIWPFADVGSYYTTSKAIYLSPQVFGFDVGASYEPNSSAINGDGGNGCGGSIGGSGTNFVNTAGAFTAASGSQGTGASSIGCDRLSSSPNNAESARRRNTVDALVRYRGTFGGFGIAATAGLMYGGHVLDSSGLAFSNNPLSATGLRPQYEGVKVGDFGVALTYAGFTVGGKYQFGRFNGQGILTVPVGLPDGEAFLGGASYTIGPVIVGAHYFQYKSAGDLQNAVQGRQRTERGLAAGGTYTVAPGLAVFLSYLYGERRQNGYNFITGQGVTGPTPTGNPFNNKTTVSFISLGTSFTW